MAAVNINENEHIASSSIFINCERAFNLIKEGKEKQAKEMFPLEWHLIQKYQHVDFEDLSALLAKKLMINS